MGQGKSAHIMEEITTQEDEYMKKETNQQQPKANNMLNDEVTAIYQNTANEQTNQPAPQPKDYDEIEY